MDLAFLASTKEFLNGYISRQLVFIQSKCLLNFKTIKQLQSNWGVFSSFGNTNRFPFDIPDISPKKYFPGGIF